MDQRTQIASEIIEGANWLHRTLMFEEQRAKNAADAGAALASEVYEYLQEPGPTVRLSLAAAYEKFIGLHAGNFTAADPSSRTEAP